MALRYLVVVEKAEHNYGAYAPDVPGCITTGGTLEETLRNMREALTGHLELLRADGDPLPLPVTQHLQTPDASDTISYVDVDLPQAS